MVQEINVRVHMPTTEEGKALLQSKLAECLADGIINIINKAPVGSRLKLYNGVLENINNGTYFDNNH